MMRQAEEIMVDALTAISTSSKDELTRTFAASILGVVLRSVEVDLEMDKRRVQRVALLIDKKG